MTKTEKTVIVTLELATALLAVAMIALFVAGLAEGRPCLEDEVCWTWSTMGNHRRGVIDLRSGERVIVGPCAFRRMWLNGSADRTRQSERMRGDWWALRHGCER